MARILTIEDLRRRYPAPAERSLRKVCSSLDVYTKTFIGLSPFVLLGSSDGQGQADVSPRGDSPGEFRVLDDRTLALADRPGNNRLDSLSNLLANPAVGLLFMVPGYEETLRVNGSAQVHDDEDLLNLFDGPGRRPITVVLVHVEEVYLHCAKSIMRSRLWDLSAHAERGLLPSMGEMLKVQGKLSGPAETAEERHQRHVAEL
jgi:PPOX class probable FMN-dependent enzyme